MTESRQKPEGATHLQDDKPESIEPEELFEGKAGALSARATQAKLADPTDRILLSPNRTPGWPQGQPSGVTIHTEEGYHDPSVSWLRNPRAGASAHFCIRRDGHIVQLVWERDRAWHARGGSNYYFGIEHEGSAYPGETNVPSFWTTPRDAEELRSDDRMLLASAHLVAYLCAKHGIPVQHDFRTPPRRDTESHIAGHDQMAGNDHRDPGPQFPWKSYMRAVRELMERRG